MAWARSMLKSRLRLDPPDYGEKRGGNRLLVWKDIPHWMVVDEDLYSLLGKLDGGATLESILAGSPRWASQKREITGLLRSMLKQGVLTDAGRAGDGKKPRKPRSIPIENIALNLTRQCNLRCRFCYNRDYLTGSAEGELSVEEIVSFLESVHPFVSKQCSLTILGGEPLMRMDELLTISEWSLKRGLVPLISTNGTLVTGDFARRAKKIGLEVQVSIDGHTAGLNDAIRGKGAFDRILKGIKTLVDSGTHTILSMVCHEGNMPYLEDFFEFARSLGANEARFIPLKLMGAATGETFQPVSMQELVLKSAAMFKKNPEFVKLAGRDAFNIIASTCRLSARRTSCGTGLQTFLLDSDGAIYPCLNTNMPEFRVAGIREDGFDFARMWNESEKLIEHRSLTSVESRKNACSRCVVRYWCLGVCRGETYVNRGALNKRAYNCEDSRAAIIEMLWLLAENADIFRESTFAC